MIAAAFPGLYTARELRTMDVRFYCALRRRARVALLREQKNAVISARLAMAQDEIFQEQIVALDRSIMRIDEGRDEDSDYRDAWESLKGMRR